MTEISKFIDLAIAKSNWVPSSSTIVTAGGPGAWEKYSGNPIMLGEAGEWDVNISSNIVLSDDVYKMWYAANNGVSEFSIGYATSSDGLTWSKYVSNPILVKSATPADWDGSFILDPTVVKMSDTDYRMWYCGSTLVGVNWWNQIGYATSSDGITWSKSGSNPVMEEGTGWDLYGFQSPHVIFDDGFFKMWVAGKDGTFVTSIGYATSPDGITWTKHASNPILSKGSGSEWDDTAVSDPKVIKDGEIYRMWYTGVTGPGTSSIGYATSPDGITWTKYAGNPVIVPGPWSVDWITFPNVILEDRIYKMWYAATGSSDNGIGFASTNRIVT